MDLVVLDFARVPRLLHPSSMPHTSFSRRLASDATIGR
jgi:hypothetical protein